MKIVSYNIQSGAFASYNSKSRYPEKMDQLVKEIKKLKADVVCLIDTYRWEEIFSEEDLRQIFGYDKAHIFPLEINDRKNPNFKSGITILSNLPVKKYKKIRLYSRNALLTTIETEGKTVDIYTVHLHYLSEELRQKQIRLILKAVKKERPSILVGDFNSITRGELGWWQQGGIVAAGILLGLGNKLKSVWGMMRGRVVEIIKNAGFRDADALRRRKTIPTKGDSLGFWGPFLRLDYLFYNNKIEVDSFEVLNKKEFDLISDHYPIMAKVSLRIEK